MTRSQASSRYASIADLGPDAQRQAIKQIGAQQPQTKPRKYRNVPTEFTSVQGFTVKADSKLEANMFAALDQLIKGGQVLFWEPHVRFRLPDDVYECDALVVSKTCVRVLDAKGKVTREFSRKSKLMQKYRGITVEIWR